MTRDYKKISPNYENDEVSVYITEDGISVHRKSHSRWKLLAWIGTGLVVVALALVVGRAVLLFEKQRSQTDEDFRLAVNKAINAAELTQIADSKTEWNTVASWWEEAVSLMKTVPAWSKHYDVAQSRVVQYDVNRQYALFKAEESEASALLVQNLWHIGSGRGIVLKLQGEPTRAIRHDSLCKEIFYFKGSKVELKDGRVIAYENVDKNLMVLEDEELVEKRLRSVDSWTLGSLEEEVLRLQGTPTQVINYESIDQTMLFYQSSFIKLEKGAVVGYYNLDRNLRVNMIPSVSIEGRSFWSLESSTEDMVTVQGTPDKVSTNGSLCQQNFHYGPNVVELKNGRVIGYQNINGHLKVK